jgi:hypothetical protein
LQEASAVKRPRVAHRPFALLTAIVVGCTLTAGCSALSPSTITKPYPAADGTNVDLPGSAVALRNFLVVGTAKGAQASVVGSVVNDGSTAVQVSLQAPLGATEQPKATVVDVQPHSSVRIGPGEQTVMLLPELTVVPGALTALSAATTAGGTTEFSVPVIPPQAEYAQLTPSPSPSPSPSPTGTPSPSGTPEAGSTPTPTPTTSDN